jgi:hypothetical protein
MPRLSRRAGEACLSPTVVALTAILLLGAALRLVGLGRDALWLDEVFTLELARAPGWGALLDLLAAHVAAPLYFMLARASVSLEPWLGLEAALRLPSALAGCLSPLAIFALVRARLDARAGLLAALALALHPAQVVQSQEARTYALEVLLAALLLLQADRAQARWRARDGALFGALGAALVLCHVLGGALVVARGAPLAIAAWRAGRPAATAALAAVATALALLLPFAPLLVALTGRVVADGASTVAVDLSTIAAVARELSGVNVAERSRAAVVVFWALALAGGAAAWRVRRADEPATLSLGLLLPLFAFVVAPPAGLYTRYFVYLLPSALLLVARGARAVGALARVRGGPPARRAAFALACGALIGAEVHALLDARAAPPVATRELAAWLDERVAPGDRVLVHAHRSPRPRDVEGERRTLAHYAPRVAPALVDAHVLPLDAPPARTFGVIVLRARHALALGDCPAGAAAIGRRIVVVPPLRGRLEPAAAAVARLAAIDRLLPGHDEARWAAVFGRWAD